MARDEGIAILIQIRGLNEKHIGRYLGKYDVLYKTTKCIESTDCIYIGGDWH
jgi:hypothetical protein